jgi:hypothetical protein
MYMTTLVEKLASSGMQYHEAFSSLSEHNTYTLYVQWYYMTHPEADGLMVDALRAQSIPLDRWWRLRG